MSSINSEKIPGDFSLICSYDDLREEEGKRFIINDEDIAVFKVENKIYVLSNRCPHQQNQVIYDGEIEDGCVICPAHGWMFNLQTGKTLSGYSGLRVFPVKVINNNIYAKVEAKKINW